MLAHIHATRSDRSRSALLTDEIPYAKFAPEAIRSTEDSKTAARRDARSDASSTVWGESTVRDVLRAKRAKRGVSDNADLASYHQRKAALHTTADTTPVAEVMKELNDRQLTFLMITGECGSVRGIVSERHIVNAIVGATTSTAPSLASAADLLGAVGGDGDARLTDHDAVFADALCAHQPEG